MTDNKCNIKGCSLRGEHGQEFCQQCGKHVGGKPQEFLEVESVRKEEVDLSNRNWCRNHPLLYLIKRILMALVGIVTWTFSFLCRLVKGIFRLVVGIAYALILFVYNVITFRWIRRRFGLCKQTCKSCQSCVFLPVSEERVQVTETTEIVEDPDFDNLMDRAVEKPMKVVAKVKSAFKDDQKKKK